MSVGYNTGTRNTRRDTEDRDIMKRNRGFTLMEMLIVVAIIAVLAAIAIPVFNGSLHKAKVAADMANVRAYYAELQTQYITTGKYIDIGSEPLQSVRRYIMFLDGTTVQMQAGMVSAMLVREQGTNEPVGYQVYYECDKGDHELLLE